MLTCIIGLVMSVSCTDGWTCFCFCFVADITHKPKTCVHMSIWISTLFVFIVVYFAFLFEGLKQSLSFLVYAELKMYTIIVASCVIVVGFYFWFGFSCIIFFILFIFCFMFFFLSFAVMLQWSGHVNDCEFCPPKTRLQKRSTRRP